MNDVWNHMERAREQFDRMEQVAAQQAHTEALWASQQPRVLVDPGKGPDDMPLRERILYEVVQATGEYAVSWGHGPTPQHIEECVCSVLDTIARYDEHGDDLQDWQRAGSDHWRLSTVVEAAADLEKLQLMKLDPSPCTAERMRPTHEGCAQVRVWQQVWAERNRSWDTKTGAYVKGFLEQNVLISLVTLFATVLIGIAAIAATLCASGKSPSDLFGSHRTPPPKPAIVQPSTPVPDHVHK